jgi:uncharacterized membrane protein
MSYLLLKYIHILSATLLFGTGLGTAFHGFLAFRSRDARVIAAVGRSVVLADWLFTTPAVIVQPATGIAMAMQAGLPLTTGWIALTFALYALVGVCWLPVVWLQIQLRAMGRASELAGTPLPERYFRFLRYWFLLGWPAFIGVLAIFYLMVLKPDL